MKKIAALALVPFALVAVAGCSSSASDGAGDANLAEAPAATSAPSPVVLDAKATCAQIRGVVLGYNELEATPSETEKAWTRLQDIEATASPVVAGSVANLKEAIKTWSTWQSYKPTDFEQMGERVRAAGAVGKSILSAHDLCEALGSRVLN